LSCSTRDWATVHTSDFVAPSFCRWSLPKSLARAARRREPACGGAEIMTFSGAVAGGAIWARPGVLIPSTTMRPVIAHAMPHFGDQFAGAGPAAAGSERRAAPAARDARKPKISLIFMPLPRQAEALNPTAKY